MNGKNAAYARIVFIVYVVILLTITAIRPWVTYHFMDGRLNTSLFTLYKFVIDDGALRFVYLFFGNILWFVPFGYYCVSYAKKSIGLTVLMGLGLSLLIETLQFVLGTGISEVDDLILNTLGCLIGALIARVTHKGSKTN
ncbi:MAG: VanZ family protein [Actinomycetaceae bacterium]|nr:VanZ family protein [Actinomycetaceae bacterium]